jgi:hypothetical protein
MLKRAHWFGVVGLLVTPALAALSWTGCQGTCASSDECAADEFCSMAVGVCVSPRAIGFCKPIPTDCPNVAQTACGCDGKTYANSCVASVSRQSLAATGVCSVSCGGVTDAKCQAGTYCHYLDGICGAGQATGTCDAVPTSCANAPQSPVCGCDKKTYNSTCEAQAAGISITSTGACPCGGPDNAGCETGRFCSYATGMCGTPNATGTCTLPPAECGTPLGTQVCGCDNKTYDSACLAAKAGVSVLSSGGSCKCGGPTNIECPLDQYCDFGNMGLCLNANPTGTCAVPPDTCSPGVDYVCGCDGKDYVNTCYAAQSGTSVVGKGKCKPLPDAGADGG